MKWMYFFVGLLFVFGSDFWLQQKFYTITGNSGFNNGVAEYEALNCIVSAGFRNCPPIYATTFAQEIAVAFGLFYCGAFLLVYSLFKRK